jgi:hypothetical protein
MERNWGHLDGTMEEEVGGSGLVNLIFFVENDGSRKTRAKRYKMIFDQVWSWSVVRKGKVTSIEAYHSL